jgi:hypothetical protein
LGGDIFCRSLVVVAMTTICSRIPEKKMEGRPKVRNKYFDYNLKRDPGTGIYQEKHEWRQRFHSL